MWGTDLTSVTTGEGQALERAYASCAHGLAAALAVDHGSTECVGVHASRSADRFEAPEPIRQAVRERFGTFAKDIAHGLALRHDHGSQYVSHRFQERLPDTGPGPSRSSRPATYVCVGADRCLMTVDGYSSAPPTRGRTGSCPGRLWAHSWPRGTPSAYRSTGPPGSPRGRVVDEDEQRARVRPVLKPAMLAAVDLHELAQGLAPQSRLVEALALLAGEPEAGLGHPAGDEVARANLFGQAP